MTGVEVLALGWHAHVEVTRTMVLALAPLVVLLLGLAAYCLTDLARAPSVCYLSKPMWAVVIVVGSCPLGALAYLFYGRDRNADRGRPSAGAAETDDEQFAEVAGSGSRL